jgi:hypothetical protein
VIDSAIAGYAILPVKQREDKAIILEFCIGFPAIIGIVKLIAVVEPCRFNAKTCGKVDAAFYDVVLLK